ncbi:MAG: hypothetical protein A2887_02505 [Alphaproteobacteria bacterium RIFCSPLOWO2_01_FULL_40_26]|nr:MAG: hypothetical protein A3D15_03275 [Alphaproteobacteria bacterium RIFCSPHIGHO2_02_FULL_40_34]OFW94856.1 MAG: hypothetical protein A2887_02505 [Alphaproteobacteria bacterium RIFCSPLOWO2_01_FULL_40_26]OFX10482.1 MAG: hypothetical protein A3H30_03915 [Alphaproteobacteria bacterium RIFCSPLOWO2_02_FULL_40_19]OFX11056.1 MAG: hypothetical protein A3G22_01370 [Alphaproteobacteria bacterium RIFCSPLOWO2_12_FULL_40_11]
MTVYYQRLEASLDKIIRHGFVLFCKHKMLVVSAIFTTLFFLESLRKEGADARFALIGDNVILWVPQLINVISQFKSLNFFGVDFYTWGGSSEFFLRPNLIIYNPFIILCAAIPMKYLTPENTIFIMVIMFYIHAFLSCYFLQKLCVRFFKFNYTTAVFVAVGYSFSIYVVRALTFFTFPFYVWLLPVGIYCALSLGEKFSRKNFILSAATFILIYTSGYVTLSMATLILIGIFVTSYHYSYFSYDVAIRKIFTALSPAFLATLIVLPFYLAVHKFFILTNPAGDFGLNGSAHALADSPLFLLRAISHNIHLKDAPVYESTLILGILSITIALVFFINLKKEKFNSEYSFKTFGISLIIFLISVLITFGNSTALSDLFYYLLRPIGGMHIYQRYLMLTNIFVMIAVGAMLQYFTKDIDGLSSVKKVLAIYVTLLAVALCANQSGLLALSGSLVFEFIAVLIFLFSLCFFSGKTAQVLAIIVIFFVPLNDMYNYSRDQQILLSSRAGNVILDHANEVKLRNYFESNSTKALSRYIDIVPEFTSYTSKNYPWIYNSNSDSENKISSYLGYEAHIATILSYRDIVKLRNPTPGAWAFYPDINFLKATGADFIIYDKASPYNDSELLKYIDNSNPKKILALKDNIVVAPLKIANSVEEKYNNGYIKILSDGEDVDVKNFKTNGANKIQFSTSSNNKISISYLFWPNERIRFYVDNKPVKYELSDEGLMRINLDAGSHEIKIKYKNGALYYFFATYSIFVISAVIILLRRRDKSC